MARMIKIVYSMPVGYPAPSGHKPPRARPHPRHIDPFDHIHGTSIRSTTQAPPSHVPRHAHVTPRHAHATPLGARAHAELV